MGIFSKLFGKIQNPQAMQKQPEDYYETEITSQYIKVTHPKRPTEQINWEEIEEIKLINTDEGPFLPDVWLVLLGNSKGCSIPQGSKGWDDVYNIVSKYEGFNFENVIKSASCTDNAEFLVWKK